MTVDLDKSDRERVEMQKRLGFIPLSVISQIRYGELSKRMLKYQGERPATRNAATDFSKDKVEMLASHGRKATAIPPAGSDREALSIMPAELVDFFVKFYAEPGMTYIDPFMAQGIQLQVAHMRGLNYLGYDLCQEFFDYCTSILPLVKTMKDVEDARIEIFCGDSRLPKLIPDGVGDFSFHSPPYWDIEYYGPEKEQLGTGETYEDFLEGMRQVAAAWLPKFKPSAYHIVNVGDFTRQGKFYCYQADTIAVFKAAGWKLHDVWVLDQIVAGSNRIFAVSSCLKKRAPRVHEYALVFRPM